MHSQKTMRQNRVSSKLKNIHHFSSVTSDAMTPWTAALQASLSLPSPGTHSNSCPLSWWCHSTSSSSVIPFSSCLQSFPASGSFQMSQYFVSGSQSTGVSVSASVLPMNIQDWFPLRWTGWISWQSKGLSRDFSSTTVWKHQFFGVLHSLWSTITCILDYWRNHSFDSEVEPNRYFIVLKS